MGNRGGICLSTLGNAVAMKLKITFIKIIIVIKVISIVCAEEREEG